MRIRSHLVITFAVAALLLLGGCGKADAPGAEVDLRIARDAYNGGYFLEAETAYERYLQSDPQGKSRLEAWNRLVEISAGVKGDLAKATTLLETATLEMGSRPKDNWPLLFRLGELYEQQGQRKRALDAWGRCLDMAAGDTERSVQTQMRMAVADRALGKADLAVDLLTKSIGEAGTPEIKSRAMYELAQTHAITWNLAKTKSIIEEILAMEAAPQDVKIMCTYLLADVYEAERNLPKARELLLSLRDTYPNPEVIVSRLANLGQGGQATAMARLQPGDGVPPEDQPIPSANVKRRRVSAK